MSSIIQLLPDHVANQIAAGRLYKDPSVKELLKMRLMQRQPILSWL
jgi:DNA mismatch repair ATPase MutL